MSRRYGGWLLLLDLDGTVWDHLDVSSLSPPFRRVGRGVIADSRGARVTLYQYMVRLALWARRRGAIVASLSWNAPFNALEALRAFRIDGVFDYHLIEPHPWKGRVLARFLRALWRERRLRVPPERIVYFDDRDIHLDDIRGLVGPVRYVRSHVNCRGFEDCSRLVALLVNLGGPKVDP